MLLAPAIFNKLSSDPAVAGIVGTPPRIYPETSPENVYPLIVFSIEEISDDAIAPLELKEFDVTVTMVSLSYVMTVAMADAVKAALDRQSGIWTAPGYAAPIDVRIANLQQPTSENTFADSGNPEQIYYTAEHHYKVWVHTE